MSRQIKIKKPLQILVLFCGALVIFPALAIQPLADQHLAESIGEQSPVQLNVVLADKESGDNQLGVIETQVIGARDQQYQQPLQILIQMKEDKLHFKDDVAARKVHETSENSFGLEPFSYVWSGNYHQIVDLDLINNKSFSYETGQYEFNNVQGRVSVIVGVY